MKLEAIAFRDVLSRRDYPKVRFNVKAAHVPASQRDFVVDMHLAAHAVDSRRFGIDGRNCLGVRPCRHSVDLSRAPLRAVIERNGMVPRTKRRPFVVEAIRRIGNVANREAAAPNGMPMVPFAGPATAHQTNPAKCQSRSRLSDGFQGVASQ